MKLLICFLIFCFSLCGYTQSNFLKKYTLKTDIGSKVTGTVFKVKALRSVALMGDGVIEYDMREVDRMYAGDSAIVIDLIGKDNLWVIKYKGFYRVAEINKANFGYSEDLYNKIYNEGTKYVEKERSSINSANFDEKLRLIESAYGKKFAFNIISNQVEIGMTQSMVLASWGKAGKKIESKRQSGTFEIWYYFDKDASVHFQNGKVTEIVSTK